MLSLYVTCLGGVACAPKIAAPPRIPTPTEFPEPTDLVDAHGVNASPFWRQMVELERSVKALKLMEEVEELSKQAMKEEEEIAQLNEGLRREVEDRLQSEAETRRAVLTPGILTTEEVKLPTQYTNAVALIPNDHDQLLVFITIDGTARLPSRRCRAVDGNNPLQTAIRAVFEDTSMDVPKEFFGPPMVTGSCYHFLSLPFDLFPAHLNEKYSGFCYSKLYKEEKDFCVLYREKMIRLQRIYPFLDQLTPFIV
jgi:hypothetical protein